MRLGREFAAEADAIGDIRAYVQDVLVRNGGSDESIDAAVLCVSELATNALLHGDGPIGVLVDVGARVRVTVHDHDHRLPVPVHARPDDVAGRGLMMVTLFADDWGTAPDEDGKVVWFELPLHHDPRPEPPRVTERRRWGRATGVSAD